MFSVVIPVFNHRQYLTQCVLSAAGSPLVKEVLLLDDGSSDGSASLAAELSGGALENVRDLTPQGRGNQGAHATLNELIQGAACEWIAVLNSDDVFTPSRFDLIHRLMRHQDFDLCFGNLLILDAQGRQSGGKRAMYDPQLPFPAGFEVNRMAAASEWLPLLAHQNFVATTSNMVFRKSLFHKVKGFAALRYVHDWDFCLRAALEGKVAYLPHAFTGYRVHSHNTIKEDSGQVDAEVRTLFDRLLSDYPFLKQDVAFSQGLAANPYLQHRQQPTLSILMPGTEGQAIYQQALQGTLNVEITSGQAKGQYLYAPVDALAALHPMHLQNAVLALEMQDLDFVLVSHTLAQPPWVGTRGLRNAVVFRQSERDVFMSGRVPLQPLKGRIVKLFPGSGVVTDLRQLIPGLTLAAAGTRRQPLPTALRSPAALKPLIFVLPAFFAVGGVERLVIDMMRQLGDRFEFVVITVEQLQQRQGSLHGSAAGTAIGFYDLAELSSPSLFLPMMERLRDVYRPSLVWIPNSSPWQCDEAAGIRRVFAGIPIVDQQVYDTEAGWISRYHEPGIRSYDRFIAINRKIEQTFIGKYGIAPEKIDLIYHSVNLNKLGKAERTTKQLGLYRSKWRLPEGKQIFGWVGRFTAQKRPVEFLQFAKRAGAADPNRHFVMIGDGELAAECDRVMEQQSITNVTRIPFSDHMGELFALMNGLLSVSEYEGLPISILEALAMGVPVYSTDVGDVGLVLADYSAGSVTPAHWDLEEYLAGFEQWHQNLPQYRRNAQVSSAAVRERFGSAAIAREYERCFNKAWEQGGECYTGKSFR